MMPKPLETDVGSEVSVAERVDAILAAVAPPVTRRAVAALAEKAQTAAVSGPLAERAEWREIARELALRVMLFKP